VDQRLPTVVTHLGVAYGLRSGACKASQRVHFGVTSQKSVTAFPNDLFRHACKLGLEGIVSKRKGSAYRSGRSPDWLKMKNADAPAVKREAEEDWGKERWR